MMNLVTLVLACSLYTDQSLPYAMIQTGSHNDALLVTADGIGRHFKKEADAVSYAQEQIVQGKMVNIGLMQISSRWLPELGARVDELFRPCKNVVLATQLLNKIRSQCQDSAGGDSNLDLPMCVLTRYRVGDDMQANVAYAHQAIEYASKHSFILLASKARDPHLSDTKSGPHSPSRTV